MNPATDLWVCGHAAERRAEIVFRPSQFCHSSLELQHHGQYIFFFFPPDGDKGLKDSIRAVVIFKEIL